MQTSEAAGQKAGSEIHSGEELSRGLKSRHIQLIALGGTIGVGLFLGSAGAIHKAGPGLLLSYAIGGIAIFFIMRALGELLTYRPVAGSFASYAEEFVGPFAGFVTGWSYWFMWVVTCMAELTAVGVYVRFWAPDIPQWLPGLIGLGILYSTNKLAVRVYGELEFWFALLKVITIVALIVAGLGVIFFKFGALGPTASFSNLYSHQGFMPFGLLGVLLTLQIVMFAYQGVELIGVTAGEAENPTVVLPKATNSIIFRILLFYIGALVIIMSLVPWDQLDPNMSPFVLMFQKMGIPAAATIINIVVITAAASSCNGGIFSTGRMLYSLALERQAPQVFGRLNSRQVPAAGINASAAVMLIGTALNYVVPKQVFTWVTSVSLIGTLWTWIIIMYSHSKYRQAVAQGRKPGVSYMMPGWPVANWLVIIFLLIVAAMFSLDADTRVALYVAPFWFGLLAIGYYSRRKSL
jgi:AAT family amino acid transporter/D-serine/D-alanine/glycine transporter